MNKKFAKLPARAKRAAFASMWENYDLWKKSKRTKKRTKNAGNEWRNPKVRKRKINKTKTRSKSRRKKR